MFLLLFLTHCPKSKNGQIFSVQKRKVYSVFCLRVGYGGIINQNYLIMNIIRILQNQVFIFTLFQFSSIQLASTTNSA